MNYFNYFTEIEEHFQRQRGQLVYLSPVDWALIASWKDAGIPLPAVLDGISRSFEKFHSGKRKDISRLRSLLYCAPAVLEAAEAAREAAVGGRPESASGEKNEDADAGLEIGRIQRHLQRAIQHFQAAIDLPQTPSGAKSTFAEIIAELNQLSSALSQQRLEELDRHLSVLDERAVAALAQNTPTAAQLEIKASFERELAPYRRGMRPEQVVMLERQFLQKRLLESLHLPRLSLFYML